MPDPLLLTPGPLTTSESVKRAMLKDWGSRDTEFIALTARVRNALLEVVGAGQDASYACVPIQGSGTFSVEAAIDTLVPRSGTFLVLANGAYGERMLKIAERLRRPCLAYRTDEDVPPSAEDINKLLTEQPTITHVAMVHCETTAGILNPLEEIAEVVVRRHRRALLVDAMSSFGALPIDAPRLGLTAVMASSNKCLEGVPGIGFVIARTDALRAAEGNASSLSLDLADQWRNFENTGQWRFTPPTHVLAALDTAIQEFIDEGGVEGRGRRYTENCRVLIDGMVALGFEPLLSHNLQAPIIVTFHTPGDANYDFERFYSALRAKGYAIYPGKLTRADSFRIGCIGRISPADLRGAVAAVGSVVQEMKIQQRGRTRAVV